MKNFLNITFFSCMLLCKSAYGWTVTEYYYSLNPNNIIPLTNNSNPVVNNGTASFPATGAFFTANNLVPNGWSFTPVSPNYWSGSIWTGFDPTDRTNSSQKGVALNGSLPSYGNSLVQLDNLNIGMQLNTWGLERPKPSVLSSSLQFATRIHSGSSPWRSNNDRLCMNAVIDLHSWYGSSVQALMTLGVRNLINPSQWFFLNFLLLDTTSANSPIDQIILDNPNDTGGAIAITHAQSNNSQSPGIRYSSPIPDYGAQLQQYSKTSFKSAGGSTAMAHYGFCISNS